MIAGQSRQGWAATRGELYNRAVLAHLAKGLDKSRVGAARPLIPRNFHGKQVDADELHV